MANNFYGGGSQNPTVISKPLEKVFEDAQHTGEIQLSCRKLREYPKQAAKYDLVDTIHAGQHLVLFLSLSVALMIHVQNVLHCCQIFSKEMLKFCNIGLYECDVTRMIVPVVRRTSLWH